MDFTWIIALVAVLLAAFTVFVDLGKGGEKGDRGSAGAPGHDGEISNNEIGAVTEEFRQDIFPGMITSFKGTQVPDGWALCDGNFGTPNLMDRFIYGANTIAESLEKTTGGLATVALTTAEMPAHYHLTKSAGPRGGEVESGNDNPGYDSSTCSENTVTGYAGGAADGAEGVGAPHNNMPPYYVLAWIMKMP